MAWDRRSIGVAGKAGWLVIGRFGKQAFLLRQQKRHPEGFTAAKSLFDSFHLLYVPRLLENRKPELPFTV
jgi:hypothetical protein